MTQPTRYGSCEEREKRINTYIYKSRPDLPIFKLDIFLHKAFGILRRYRACFPPPRAAAMNDWSGTYVPGGARVSISITLSLSLSFSFSIADRSGQSGKERPAFHPLSIVLVVGEKIRYAPGPGCAGITRATGWCIARGSPPLQLARVRTRSDVHGADSRPRDPSRTKDRRTDPPLGRRCMYICVSEGMQHTYRSASHAVRTIVLSAAPSRDEESFRRSSLPILTYAVIFFFFFLFPI